MADTGIFYGTGASEGVPSPFCDCPMCNYAREHGGKDVRKRSCFRLGRNIMIDMGPDIFTQALQYGSMCDIEHVLITHTHDDHFDFTALGLMSMATHLRTTPVARPSRRTSPYWSRTLHPVTRRSSTGERMAASGR